MRRLAIAFTTQLGEDIGSRDKKKANNGVIPSRSSNMMRVGIIGLRAPGIFLHAEPEKEKGIFHVCHGHGDILYSSVYTHNLCLGVR